MIRFENVSKTYRRGTNEVHAVDQVSLEIEGGRLTFMVGPSGSGKSTLLHLAGGLDRPTAGKVVHDQRDLTSLDDAALSRFRRHKVGFVFQQFHLLSTLTALENVLLPTVPEGTTNAHRERALSLLEMFGLAERVGHRPNELSGGECQRVSIARALVYDAPVILADEPTGELDSTTGALIMKEIRRLSGQDGRTVVVVTHDLTHIQDGDAVFHMKDGRVVERPVSISSD